MSQLISNDVSRGYMPPSWSWPEPSSFLPSPHHVQIKNILFDGGPCLTRRSLLRLWMPMLVWKFLPQPLQTNTWPTCCQIMCWLCIDKDLNSLSQTLQTWTLSLSVFHRRLYPLQKAFSKDLQVYDDGKWTKLSPIKKVLISKVL